MQEEKKYDDLFEDLFISEDPQSYYYFFEQPIENPQNKLIRAQTHKRPDIAATILSQYPETKPQDSPLKNYLTLLTSNTTIDLEKFFKASQLNYDTALQLAAKFHHIPAIQFFLERKIIPNKTNYASKTAFDLVIQSQDIDAIYYLFDNSPIPPILRKHYKYNKKDYSAEETNALRAALELMLNNPNLATLKPHLTKALQKKHIPNQLVKLIWHCHQLAKMTQEQLMTDKKSNEFLENYIKTGQGSVSSGKARLAAALTTFLGTLLIAASFNPLITSLGIFSAEMYFAGYIAGATLITAGTLTSYSFWRTTGLAREVNQFKTCPQPYRTAYNSTETRNDNQRATRTTSPASQ